MEPAKAFILYSILRQPKQNSLEKAHGSLVFSNMADTDSGTEFEVNRAKQGRGCVLKIDPVIYDAICFLSILTDNYLS